MLSLKNKNVIVTGGGSGIGKSICLLFAQKGANVFIVDYDISNALKVKEEITKFYGLSSAYACDVSKAEEVKAVIEEIIAKENIIDILINNAGIAHIGNIETTEEIDFDRVMRVNVKGTYYFMKYTIPQMKASGGGVILNMASIASVVGIQDRFAYSMSKGAVLTMSLSVARDYLPFNIRCNCISPARVHTPFVDNFIKENYPGQEKEIFDKLSQSQPIGRMGRPEEIANLALYLCSDESSFITGSNFPIDGGFITLK